MLTAVELDEFRLTGLLHLEKVVPDDVLEPMVDRLWRLMKQQHIKPDDPSSWERVAPYYGIRGVHKLQNLRDEHSGPEEVPAVREALDEVFSDRRRTSARHWGQALVTLPVAEAEWLLPGNIWHFDHPYQRPGEISGVNVFLLMDDVAPGGGGTVVLRNAPLLMDAFLATNPNLSSARGPLSAQNKGFLRFDPWLAGLKCKPEARSMERNRRYMAEDTSVHGVPVRIVELTGSAGDVFITHPALLHAPAMNVTERPRLMRTQRVRIRDQ